MLGVLFLEADQRLSAGVTLGHVMALTKEVRRPPLPLPPLRLHAHSPLAQLGFPDAAFYGRLASADAGKATVRAQW